METEAKSVKSLAQDHIALLRDRTKTTTQDAKCSFLKTAQKYIPNPIAVALFHVGLPKLKTQSLSQIIFVLQSAKKEIFERFRRQKQSCCHYTLKVTISR